MKQLHAVLFSGGVDSTTLLTKLLVESGKDDKVLAVVIDYGQTHRIETKHAQMILQQFVESTRTRSKLEKLTAQLGTQLKSFATNLALPKKNEVIKGFRAPVTTFPYRNAILALLVAAQVELSLAAGYPYKVRDFDEVIVYEAIHKIEDEREPEYPDTKAEFAFALDTLLSHTRSLSIPVRFKAPFLEMSKREIVELAWVLGAPLHLTWTCYDPQSEKPCGKCASCIARSLAFKGFENDPAFSDEMFRKWEENFHKHFHS